MFRGFSLVTLCVLTIPVVAFVCVVGAWIFLPLPANLPTPKATLSSQGTHIYDVDGNEVALLRKFDQNIPVQRSDIPEVMKQAIISSEDHNFYKHRGVDPRGALRALWADLRNKTVTQGGSTITQQYVKLAYTNQERTLTRKIREAILASQLDRQVDKDEILYRYLSAAYFGDGAYGIGAAAESYFHKPVSQLNASEAAMLVGIVPAPTARAPREDPETAEGNRKAVLKEMLQQHYLTQPQYEDAVAHPVWLESQGTPNGPVTMVFKATTPEPKYPYYVDYVKRYLVNKYGEDRVYTGGLRVQTALDPAMQDDAEASVTKALAGTSAPLDMALVSVEPQTGFVKALVGGRDFKKAQVNLALGGCPPRPRNAKGQLIKVQVEPTCWSEKSITGGGTGRQPGSSFKTYVLASAFEVGIPPTKVYSAPSAWSPPGCKGSTCVVHNYESEGGGSATLKVATAESFNTVFAPLIRDVGTKETGHVVDGFIHTANLAKKLGVTSAYYAQDFHQTGGNYALGTIDVSPLDMAAAYSVFANRGEREPATPVVKILDVTGKTLEDNSNRQATRVVAQNVADNVTDTLRGVVDHGTAYPNAQIGRPAAGKTGTTESFTNAWFVGYTPTLSTAVWLGYSDRPHTINYKGNTKIAGGTVPAATWGDYMKKALKDVPVTDFSQPAPITAVNSNALTQQGGTTTIPPIVPQTVRPPDTTPTGSYDRTVTGPPSVAPPSTTTTVPSSLETVPSSGAAH